MRANRAEEDQIKKLRDIARAIQDDELPTCTQSDVIRTSLEILLSAWPDNRKKIVAAIRNQRQLKSE